MTDDLALPGGQGGSVDDKFDRWYASLPEVELTWRRSDPESN